MHANFYLFIGAIISTAQRADGFTNRRVPVSVFSPQYVRLSSDPKTTEDEETVAKTKGVNICARRFEKPKTKHETICDRRPLICKRFNIATSDVLQRKHEYYTKYECCQGYERVANKEGCPKDKYASNFNIIEVAKRLGLSKFVFLARKTVLYYTLRRFRFLTVFIPTNDALDKYLHTKVGRETSTNEYKLRLFLMMHIFSGRWPTVVMKDRRKLENFLPGSYGEVNILFDAKRMIIQNALVINQNQPASNGIVHVIDDALNPTWGSIRDIVAQNRDLSIFNNALKMINHTFNGFNTIFAPTDQVFRSFNINSSEHLMESFKCVEDFILTHIVHGIFFTAILKEKKKIYLRNHIGDMISISKNHEKTYLKNRLVNLKYFAGSDGSVYIINRLIVSSKALSIQKLTRHMSSLSVMHDLISRTNIDERLSSTSRSFTLFLPSDEAMNSLGLSKLKNLENEEEAIKFLLDHILAGEYHSSDFRNGLEIKSEGNNSIAINKRNSLRICVQGSVLSYRWRNIPACNGLIHVIVSYPIAHSKYSLLDILNKDTRFSILSMALKISGMNDRLRSKSAITIFAPTNDAWSKLDNRTLTKIFEDNEELNYTMKYHMIYGKVYSCYVKTGQIAPFSLTGTRVRVSSRDYHSNKLLYNYAETVESDITASNGVLHAIDQVALYLSSRRYNG